MIGKFFGWIALLIGGSIMLVAMVFLAIIGFLVGGLLGLGLTSSDVGGWIGGLIGAAIGALFVWWKFTDGLGFGAKMNAPNLGSADFASEKEMVPLTSRNPESLAVGWLPTKAGKSLPLLYYNGPGHLLTVAPTRSGKGVGAIIPNLLIADRSVFVIDPKGENVKITARQRKTFGKVFVLDPFDASGQPKAAYNPLATMQASSLDLGEEAAVLADALVLSNPDSKEGHWDDEAKALIAGVIMYVVATEAPADKTLDRVRQYLTLPPAQYRAFLQEMSESNAAGGLVARTGGRFMGKDDKEAAGVLSTAQRHTQFLDSPRISESLSRSDFSFADLAKGVVSVFLVLPPDRLETYNRWLRLMINAALKEMARAPRKPERPILFLLDEFAALGPLDEIRRGMGLMAGYGVQLWPILQDFSQLRSIYGKGADTFISNAAVLQAFAVRDLTTANMLSDMLGQTTIGYTTASENRGSSGTWTQSSSNEGTGVSQQFQARKLMTADEVMNMVGREQLLFIQGHRPMLVGRIEYFSQPEFAGKFDKA